MPISFKPPIGPALRDPSHEELRRIILEEGAAYWDRGSGDVGIWHDQAGRHSELGISRSASGLMVLRFGDEEGDYFLARDQAEENWETVWPGGEAWVIGAELLVDRELVWAAVEQFLANGRIPQSPFGHVWCAGDQIRRVSEE